MLLASQDVRHFFGKSHLKTQPLGSEKGQFIIHRVSITYQNNFWEVRLNWLIWGNLPKIYQNPGRKEVSVVCFDAHFLQKAFEIN